MKVLTLLSLASLAWLSSPSLAVTVAVIDSGVDYKHRDLSSLMWLNDGDHADNQADDDNNGYVDDVYGWNFAEGNNQVIDYQYLDKFSEDCYEFFRVQGRMITGTATDADKQWYEKKKADATFIQELSSFANFVHGSHVAGIASTSRSTERLLAVKIIATRGQSLGVVDPERLRATIATAEAEDNPLSGMLIRWMLNSLVDQQVGVIVKAGEYVAARKADVANGSFGISYAAAQNVVKSLLQMIYQREPTDDEVKEHTNYMVGRINEKCSEFVKKAPGTVFVFAAGNDGTNNDDQTMAPANVGEPNVISVAASLGIKSLAKFSNFGAKTVDVAAPGVMINSTVPGDKYLEMSGTSMAAPYVAQVAALVKEANPKLTAIEVKKIIVETVDAKDYLVGKVRAGGVVNLARAAEAGKLSRDMTVEQAIAAAAAIPDATEAFDTEAAFDVDITPVPLPTLLH